eukprot:GHVP01008146.1.p1 GENE.GHVP01008146.1~~GHVP01008146.1.p1  ORF type:complete len:155 (-),score=9.96 GHVP01008146.1:294-758(-)
MTTSLTPLMQIFLRWCTNGKLPLRNPSNLPNDSLHYLRAERQLRHHYGGLDRVTFMTFAPVPSEKVFAEEPPSAFATVAGVPCLGCGGTHFRRDCPHKEVLCTKCRRSCHIVSVCRTMITGPADNPQVIVERRRGKVTQNTFLDETFRRQASRA